MTGLRCGGALRAMHKYNIAFTATDVVFEF